MELMLCRPGREAAMLLATYDFAHANKVFCFNLVALPAEKAGEQPFASYISLTSYMLQWIFTAQPRANHYAYLNLMVFRLLVEDPGICRRMCSDESKTAVRLCRQRQPRLPLVTTDRALVASVLDMIVDGINHNLKKSFDTGLYTLLTGILLRIISFLSRTKTRLAKYHWAELFRSLLELIQFLARYAEVVKDALHAGTVLDHVVNLLALSLSAGETFLPSPADYDDLFYKVIEKGEVLIKFRDAFGLSSRPTNSIATLINVSTHYKKMLEDGVAAGGRRGRVKVGSTSTLTSLQVADVIKQGYDTLSIQTKEGLDRWDEYRERDERALLKWITRTAVADVQRTCREE